LKAIARPRPRFVQAERFKPFPQVPDFLLVDPDQLPLEVNPSLDYP
jgi:hypothetical protein